MNPDEAVAWPAQTKKAGDEAVALDTIQEFVLTQTRGRFKTKQLAYCSIRSYLMGNRFMLPQDPSFTIRGDEPPGRTQTNDPELEKDGWTGSAAVAFNHTREVASAPRRPRPHPSLKQR
jgi:hypothetical protein